MTHPDLTAGTLGPSIVSLNTNKSSSSSSSSCSAHHALMRGRGRLCERRRGRRRGAREGAVKTQGDPMTPIWDSKWGQIIVARLVFDFVTRRIWFSRAEVKHSFFPNTMASPKLIAATSRPMTRPQHPSPRGCHSC